MVLGRIDSEWIAWLFILISFDKTVQSDELVKSLLTFLYIADCISLELPIVEKSDDQVDIFGRLSSAFPDDRNKAESKFGG